MEGMTVVARILLIESMPITLINMKVGLEEHGCVVDAVGFGRDAIKLTKKNDYALVLIDLQLLDLPSFSVAESVLKNKPKSIIIALTSDNSAELLQKCAMASMVGFLMKPFDPKRILPYIEG
jgi:two-component system, response regulator PdtaR